MPTWIDEAVPRGSSVAVVWRESGSRHYAPLTNRQRVVWLNEFFNRSVGHVYELGPKMPYNLPAERVRNEQGHIVDVSNNPVSAAYVLVRCPMAVEGVLVREDVPSGARLYRTDGAVRLAPAIRCARQ